MQPPPPRGASKLNKLQAATSFVQGIVLDKSSVFLRKYYLKI